MTKTTLLTDLNAVTPSTAVKVLTPCYPVPPIVSAPARPYSPEMNIVHLDLARLRFTSHQKPHALNLRQLANEAALLVGDRKELRKRSLLMQESGFMFVYEPDTRSFMIASSMTGITHHQLYNAFRLLHDARTYSYPNALTGPFMKGAFELSAQGRPMLSSATFLEETYGTAVKDDPIIANRCLRSLGNGFMALGAQPDMPVKGHVTAIPSVNGILNECVISTVNDLAVNRISLLTSFFGR